MSDAALEALLISFGTFALTLTAIWALFNGRGW